MKLSVAAILLLCSSVASESISKFYPTRISYDALMNQEENGALLEALRTVGIVAISIPNFGCKTKALKTLPACIEDSPTASEVTFPDGTRRRTLATHSLAGDMSPLEHAPTDACVTFAKASLGLREIVADVTEGFAIALEAALEVSSTPILTSASGQDFELQDAVNQGEHLEHFHSYDAPAVSTQDETIEWHTDQGLALIFTPGLVKDKASEGFYIRLQDGSTAMVEFDTTLDDLVILLGDGVNQYVNPNLPNAKHLRALPHSLQMPETNGEPRVWYGRMVLPPPEAIHPVHQESFGDLREKLMTGDESSKSLGCSSTLQARELEEITCEVGTQFYCWHRCFNYTDEVSPGACAWQQKDVACINEERELWSGAHNKSFAPGCVDLATAVTAVNPEAEGSGTDTDGTGTHNGGDGTGTHDGGDGTGTHDGGDSTGTHIGVTGTGTLKGDTGGTDNGGESQAAAVGTGEDTSASFDVGISAVATGMVIATGLFM